MTKTNETARVYNLSLLCAFLANVFQLVSVSLLFRYADFITSIGGDEWHLGWVVGVSSVGAILFRLVQGSAIDAWGAERIWYACLIGQVLGLIWHLQIESVNSVSIYFARTLYASSLAGTFGAWLSFVSLQAPKDRVAEVIGVIGASGFVGMAAGPVIGDYIFNTGESFAGNVDQLFTTAIFSLTLAFVFAVLACRLPSAATAEQNNSQEASNQKTGNPLKVIVQAKPGFILVLGALMGLTIGTPGTYLRPFAASLDIERIKVFFLVYNLTAFTSRLIFHKSPQRFGLKLTICVGFSLMMISMLLYLVVEDEWGLMWPALAGGLAHSFLFPSVIAACTNQFSTSNRGVATNLILAMYDLGTSIGMPLVGVLLTQSRRSGLPPYNTTFSCIAAVVVITIVTYITMSRKHISRV